MPLDEQLAYIPRCQYGEEISYFNEKLTREQVTRLADRWLLEVIRTAHHAWLSQVRSRSRMISDSVDHKLNGGPFLGRVSQCGPGPRVRL